MTINELLNEEAIIIKTKKDADSLIDNMNEGDMFVITLKDKTISIKKSDGKFWWSKDEAGRSIKFIDSSRNYVRDLLYINRIFNKIERK